MSTLNHSVSFKWAKLPAFTIIEIVVMLIITSIVMGMAILVFDIIQQQFFTYRKQHEALAEQKQLHSLLHYDMADAQKVVREGNVVSMTYYQDKPPVRYVFQEQRIIRSMTVHLDTFDVAPKELQLLFQGEMSREAGLVDQIAFQIVHKHNTQMWRYVKTYDAATLLAWEADHPFLN